MYPLARGVPQIPSTITWKLVSVVTWPMGEGYRGHVIALLQSQLTWAWPKCQLGPWPLLSLQTGVITSWSLLQHQ